MPTDPGELSKPSRKYTSIETWLDRPWPLNLQCKLQLLENGLNQVFLVIHKTLIEFYLVDATRNIEQTVCSICHQI